MNEQRPKGYDPVTRTWNCAQFAKDIGLDHDAMARIARDPMWRVGNAEIVRYVPASREDEFWRWCQAMTDLRPDYCDLSAEGALGRIRAARSEDHETAVHEASAVVCDILAFHGFKRTAAEFQRIVTGTI